MVRGLLLGASVVSLAHCAGKRVVWPTVLIVGM